MINTRRYDPLRGGLWPLAKGFFSPSGRKKTYFAVLANFRHFWCPVVTSVSFSSNQSNLKKEKKKRNPNPQNIHKKCQTFYNLKF